MKKCRIVRVGGYKAGEVVELPDNRALTYALNGQVEAVGWSPPKGEPQNRMLDTSGRGHRRKRETGKEE